ncbi:MAG: ThuA domain-containing protein [Vicinamibacterales bacterium]
MTMITRVFATLTGCLLVAALATAQNPHLVVYQGTSGPGQGKHLVFLAGDQEYRSEESLPALARILAKHYGFTCSVFFTVDADTGFINPGNSRMSGLEALDTADLLVVFLRFQDFPDDQMQHIAAYVDRGGPIVAFRTATHSFQIKRPEAKFLKFDWQNKGDYVGGFGRQVLGETWVSHYGANHKMSSKLILDPAQAAHPVLRGVKDVWVQSGGYTADPLPPSTILARGQILNGMTPDSPPAADKQQMPVAWVRSYTGASGKTGRVFTTTHGASEDLLNDGFRRMAVNAALWAVGLDAAIKENGEIGLVGPYHPSTFDFSGHVRGIKPADMAGWDTPIPPRK